MAKRKTLENKLDTLWSEKIRSKGKCEVCSKASPLNAHHYYSRSCKSVRWDLDNGFCLCVGHHVFSSGFSAHKTPAEFVEWAVRERGEQWHDELNKRKNTDGKYHLHELEEMIEKLKLAF